MSLMAEPLERLNQVRWPGIVCPACGGSETVVTDSRGTERGEVRRRRRCPACDHRFTTYERLAEQGTKRNERLRALLRELLDIVEGQS